MKRYRAPGDPGEFGDWIVGVVRLADEDEAGFSAALHDLVAATRDMEAFMELPDGSTALHYTLRFSRDGGLDALLHERDFWPRAVQFAALRPYVVKYIEQVTSGDEGDSWQDEFHPRGSYAIAELALVDVKACALLGSVLFKWDMAHETWQEGLIDELIAKYGMVEPTRDLLACRILADGQAASEQVASALYNHGHQQDFDLAEFASRCASRVADSVSPGFGLEQFALIYADGDEAAYKAAWTAFRASGIAAKAEGFDAANSRALARQRSSPADGHWNAKFLDASVEDFRVESLELLDD